MLTQAERRELLDLIERVFLSGRVEAQRAYERLGDWIADHTDWSPTNEQGRGDQS